MTGGGKDESKITPHYADRRRALIERVSSLLDPASPHTLWFAGHALFWVGVDLDSLAPTYTPDDLFESDIGIRLVAPWNTGYVIEVPAISRDALLRRLRHPHTIPQRVDISRIISFRPLHKEITPDSLKQVWATADLDRSGGPASFVVSLPPFQSAAARDAVLEHLWRWMAEQPMILLGQSLPLESGSDLVLPNDGQPGGTPLVPGAAADQRRRIETSYRAGHHPRLPVTARLREALFQGSERGLIVRWDPVTPLAPARPGGGREPDLDREISLDEPIVGHIDGGFTSRRYRPAVVWEADPFLAPADLDTNHGNCTAALIVEAHGWNTDLDLPPLHCRLGIVPAVPRSTYSGPWDLGALILFLDGVLKAHPETTVWNISANLRHACERNRVSEFGHQLSQLARRHKVLFVVSTGNRTGDGEERIAPPADAEAALTVAGRLPDGQGKVGDACPVSRVGLGPDEMLKPELSWFSVVQVIGGRYGRASSYAAALVSRLAAHTWAHLRQPSPDLVKALLINAADGGRHHYRRGYGSPVRPQLPWETDDNTVTLCWQGRMSAKLRYYWEGIEIPLSLRQGGLFHGRVRLVCILAPVTHMRGTNYASTRLEAALQYRDGNGDWTRLAGSLPSDTAEGIARAKDAKWQPLRCYNRRTRRGVTLGGPELRLSARLFWRDRYLHPELQTDEVECDVTFIVTLQSADHQSPVHAEFTQAMDGKVEHAVIEPDIEIDSNI